MTRAGKSMPPQEFDGGILYYLSRLQRLTRGMLESELEKYNMSAPQFAAMNVVKRTGTITNAALARRSYVTPQTMYRIVSELIDRGLLVNTDEPDGRSHPVRLTPKGEKMLSDLDSAHRAVIAAMTGGDDEAADRFNDLLIKFCSNMDMK